MPNLGFQGTPTDGLRESEMVSLDPEGEGYSIFYQKLAQGGERGGLS